VSALLTAKYLSLGRRLHDVSLSLEPGEILCLIGPNGSGKTSLLHALAGIGSPSGSVSIGGLDPHVVAPAQRRRLLSYLPASRDIAWPMAALDVIALGGGAPEAIEQWIEKLELGTFAAVPVNRLSTGERSRVLIARALASRPLLLLLDEPTANLDPLWQLRFMDLLVAEVRGTGRGAIVAMHDLDAAARYADRLIVMNGGAIAAQGNAAILIEGAEIREVFGVQRGASGWQAVRPPADPRSSP
jgi:iron complex transport system ATP-binding protein